MAHTTDDDRASRTKDDIRQWPWQAQFTALLIVLAIATFLIVLPVLVVRVLDVQYAFSSETDLWAAMIGILLGLTTMTVSGVFVFMTFRIERGAKLEAQDTAKEAAKKTAVETMEKESTEVVNKMKNKLIDQFDESQKTIHRLFAGVQENMSEIVAGVQKMQVHVEQGQKNIQNTVSTLVKGVEKVQNQVEHGTQNIQKEMSTLVKGVEGVQDQVEQGQRSIQNTVSTLVRGMEEVQDQVTKGRKDIQRAFENSKHEMEKSNTKTEGTGETPDAGGTGDPNKK